LTLQTLCLKCSSPRLCMYRPHFICFCLVSPPWRSLPCEIWNNSFCSITKMWAPWMRDFSLSLLYPRFGRNTG
jgi:hypothetical protein